MVKLIEGNGIGNKVIAHFIDMKVCTFKCIEDFSRRHALAITLLSVNLDILKLQMKRK